MLLYTTAAVSRRLDDMLGSHHPPVSLSVTQLRCASIPERIDILLGVESPGNPRNTVLDDPPRILGDFRLRQITLASCTFCSVVVEADNVTADDGHRRVCRTLISSIYRQTDGHQPANKLRASLLRRFGMTEFTRLHGDIRSLLTTSRGGEVARQRRLDSIFASNEVASLYFPLFFQLVQLEAIVGRD